MARSGLRDLESISRILFTPVLSLLLQSKFSMALLCD